MTVAGRAKNGTLKWPVEFSSAFFARMKAASLKAYMTETYVELHCRSAFSFLRGASTPEQLAERAAQLQMPAVALCDRDGVYGAPRFFARAKELGIRPIVGAEITMDDGVILPVLA